MQKKIVLLATLLLVAGLVLAGCGPRAGGGQLAASAAPEDLVIDLPAIYIDVNTEGQTSIGGTPVSELGSQLGVDLSAAAQLDKSWVNHFTATNIQHLQIDNTANGLVLLANGEPVPSLGWDGEALTATADTLNMLGANVGPQIGKLLPLIRALGVGVVVRFPVVEGTPLVPLVVQSDESAAALAQKAQEEYLQSVGTPPVVQVTVNYAADGTFTMADIGGTDLASMGIPVQSLNLPAAQIAQMTQLGIKKLSLASNAEGIFIGINDRMLPHITWGDGAVNHVLKLAAQMGFLDQIQGYSPEVHAMIESLLPAVQASDVNLSVTFP